MIAFCPKCTMSVPDVQLICNVQILNFYTMTPLMALEKLQ